MSITNNEQSIQQGVRINVSGNLIIVSRCHSYSGVCTGLGLGDRGEIQSFSDSSRARLRKYLRETRADYKSMVTLTYPRDCGFDGSASKEHLRRFLQELRRGTKHGTDKWSAFWFLEFQKRGAIHFHILCTNFYHYEWIAKKWYDIVGSGQEDHLQAGTRIEKIRAGRNGIASYCAKYAAKFDQKLIPEGFGWVGRFWGVSGYRDRLSAATYITPGLEGRNLVKNGLQRIKKIISGPKSREISNLMKDLPPGIKIYSISDRGMIPKLIREVKLIELYCAIVEKREPNFEDEIAELYDPMITHADFMLEEGDYSWSGSVTTNQNEASLETTLRKMPGESFAEWLGRVGTGIN